MSRRKFRKRSRKVWSPPQGCSQKAWWAWYEEYLASRAWNILRAKRIEVESRGVHDLRTLCVDCHKDQHATIDRMKQKEREREREYNQAESQAHHEERRRKRLPFQQDLTHRRRPNHNRTAP